MNTSNPLLACDFYKVSHKFQYPQGTQYIYSNFTPRSSKLANKLESVFEDKIVFFGLQRFIKKFLIETFNTEFFQKPLNVVLNEYKRHMTNALGGLSDYSHIEALHKLGYLPITIKALPEGSLVNIKVPVLTITNTHPDFYWVPNYLESVMSAELWKPCTTATTSYQYRKLLEKYADETGANKDFVLWQGHDFSMRGLSGLEDCANSGGGHLLSFYGTDSIPAIESMEQYYSGKDTFIGGSVPASEHSVMTLLGQDNEKECIKRLITEVHPTGVVSVVCDGYDYWNVITNTAVELKEEILSRKENALGLAKVVFRPDSGDPVKIICGTVKLSYSTMEQAISSINDQHYIEAKNDCKGSYNCGSEEYSTIASVNGVMYRFTTKMEYNRHDKEYYYIDNYSDGYGETIAEEIESTPEMRGSVECLWDIFGGTINAQGYKELNPRVGIIYGDSITLERAEEILKQLKAKGFASSNIIFGIGSYTYQYVTRDSYGFAMKATHAIVNSVPHDIYKYPKTGDGSKKSAKGLLRVDKDSSGKYVLSDQQSKESEQGGELKVVFHNGKLVKEQSLSQIRETLFIE